MMHVRDDVLGFAHEARQGSQAGFCLALKQWCADQAKAQVEAKYGRPYEELGHEIWMGEALYTALVLYGRVAVGEEPCPLLDSCKIYARKKAEGHTFVWEDHTRQLDFLDLAGEQLCTNDE